MVSDEHTFRRGVTDLHIQCTTAPARPFPHDTPEQRNFPSQVTFGDYEGKTDTPAGSLTRGWSVVVPPLRDTGGIGGDVLKALVGTDAVACAAGAGQIPGRDTALEEAGILRDSGTTLESVVEGLHAVGQNDGRLQVSVPAGGVPYPGRAVF